MASIEHQNQQQLAAHPHTVRRVENRTSVYELRRSDPQPGQPDGSRTYLLVSVRPEGATPIVGPGSRGRVELDGADYLDSPWSRELAV